MKFLTLVAFCIAPLIASAQTPPVEWQACAGGNKSEFVYDMSLTSDGGYITVGRTRSDSGALANFHGGPYDAWVAKLDSNRNLQWQRCFGGSNEDHGVSVIQTADGGFLIGAETLSTNGDVTSNHGSQDVWLIKLDTAGTIEWQKTYGGELGEAVGNAIQTPDGGFIFTGYTNSNDGDVVGYHVGTSTYYDAWVVKLDNAGNIEWSRCYGGTEHDIAMCIQNSSDGGYIVAGNSFSDDGDLASDTTQSFDVWILKLDENGGIQWSRTYGGSNWEQGESIVELPNGGYVFAGFSSSVNGDVAQYFGDYDAWIGRLDNVGNLIWQQSFGDDTRNVIFHVEATQDGGWAAAGYDRHEGTDPPTLNAVKGWVTKFDANGSQQWQRDFFSYRVELRCVRKTPDGGLVACGDAMVTTPVDVTCQTTHYDMWLVKLGATNAVQETDPTQHYVVYPNPATNSITVHNPLATKSTVHVRNTLGQICFQFEIAGLSGATVPVTSLTGGMYLLEFTSDAGYHVQRILVE